MCEGQTAHVARSDACAGWATAPGFSGHARRERVASGASSSAPTRRRVASRAAARHATRCAHNLCWCACSGADKPTTPVTAGRLPAAYLAHGTHDPLVSVYYSCALASRLTGLGYDVSVNLRAGDGHVLPPAFASGAWPFLYAHRRP